MAAVVATIVYFGFWSSCYCCIVYGAVATAAVTCRAYRYPCNTTSVTVTASGIVAQYRSIYRYRYRYSYSYNYHYCYRHCYHYR